MLTLNEVKNYNATRRNSAESDSLIERIPAIFEEVIKSSSSKKTYLAHKYNKFHRNVKYQAGQKVLLMVENITIEQPSQKLVRQRYGSYSNIE